MKNNTRLKAAMVLLAEIEAAYRALHFRHLVNNSALWLAADALHRHDSPRDTETDDVCEWRAQAEETETTREKTGMNTTPLILTKVQAFLKES